MKLLHTSDWHIGRTFHGHDLLADQERVLGAVADLVQENEIDVVLVSGDIYDRAVPSADAVQVATRLLKRIHGAGATIIASSGNHDSAARLGAFAGFLAAGGLHIRTQLSEVAEPVMLTDDHGPIAVYPIPYLEPDIARQAFGLAQARSHQSVMAEAMRRVRADLATRGDGVRSVVLAHAFVVGGVAGDTERSIAVGGVESVTADLFDDIDYVALGHLHRSQVLAEHLRYSGSPLPYSFNEAGQVKVAWLVEFSDAGLKSVAPIDLPVARPMAVLRGELDEILAGNQHLAGHYLSVELTDDVRPMEPMRRLREAFPYALKLDWQPSNPQPVGPDFSVARREVDPQTLVAEFVSCCRGAEADELELEWVEAALTRIRQDEAAL